MKIHLESPTIHNIPTLIVKPEKTVKCPVIFFIPGYRGKKEHGLSLGYQLAQMGFFFISLDPLFHGERYDPILDNASDPAYGGVYPSEMGMDTGLVMYNVIRQCLDDTRMLIDHFMEDRQADVQHCGVTGLSTGGYASYLIFAELQEIKAAVPMIGLPHFSRRWKDLLDESAYSNPEWADALRKIQPVVAEHTRFIEEIDPYEKLKDAAPKALLMMSCDFDTDQPKLYNIYAYQELLPSYQDAPNNLRLRIYPAGHEVTPQMEEEAVAWFSRHLRGIQHTTKMSEIHN